MTANPLPTQGVPEDRPLRNPPSLPAFTRPQYQSPEKQSLLAMIEDLRSDMSDAQELFERKDEVDAANASKRNELATKITELTLQLQTMQAELDALNDQGSVRDQFIKSAGSFEQRVSSIASGVYNWILDHLSQQKYESNHRELTDLLKEEILFRANKLGIKPLTQGSFARLHKHRKEQITNELVNDVMERVYTATETLEKVLEK